LDEAQKQSAQATEEIRQVALDAIEQMRTATAEAGAKEAAAESK
jgi:hypothetical protein